MHRQSFRSLSRGTRIFCARLNAPTLQPVRTLQFRLNSTIPPSSTSSQVSRVLVPSSTASSQVSQVIVPTSQKWFVQVLQYAIGLGTGYYVATLVNNQLESSVPSSNGPLIPKFGTIKDFEQAMEKLKLILTADRITMDKSELFRHGHSDWSYHDAEIPSAVVYPLDTAEVSMIMKIANEYRIPIIPFTGGTSLEGNFSAPSGGICIDLSHMDNIIKLHEADMDVVVQAGVQWEELNSFLKRYGLFFPIDPGPGACIGGMIGTACSGTNAVRYGTMREWVINLTVVLPDGTIVKTKQRSRKSSAGYDLTKLFIGSEGTLGVVTEATLKLAAIPEETSVIVCDFPTVQSAASTVSTLVRSGMQLAAIELLDEVMMHAISLSNPKLNYPHLPTLFLKFSGSRTQNENDIKTVKAIAMKNGCGKFKSASTPREREDLWEGRKTALWNASLLKPGASVWTTDVVVPVGELPKLIAETKEDLMESKIVAPMVGHVGDGNFHVLFLFDKNNPDEMAETQRLNARLVERAIKLDGSCTGEHGVGIGKKKYLTSELGAETIKLMWQLKRTIDPKGIMNPGKVLPDTLDLEDKKG